MNSLRVRTTVWWVCLVVLCVPSATVAQTQDAATRDPAIRQWLDVQAVQAGLRYRWNRNSAGVETADGVQWHGLTRGRLLLAPEGRVTLTAMASAGPSFVASWNDTGIGSGDFVGRFALRHLFLTVAPSRAVEVQVGGLAPNRGEVSENLSYDMDGYLVGQRLTLRPATGRVTQVSGTIGHLGDVLQPNVFRRFDDLFDYNYGQLLVGLRLHTRVSASVDYTWEDGRHIVREAVVVRPSADVPVVTGLRVEAYQRVDPGGHGLHAAADLRIGRLSVTTGLMSVDRRYVPTINGDRYGVGTRWYSIGTLPVTGDVTLTWYHTRAFRNTFPVPVHHRFDLIMVVNPTARLKRAGIF